MSRDPILFLEDIEKASEKVCRYTEGQLCVDVVVFGEHFVQQVCQVHLAGCPPYDPELIRCRPRDDSAKVAPTPMASVMDPDQFG